MPARFGRRPGRKKYIPPDARFVHAGMTIKIIPVCHRL